MLLILFGIGRSFYGDYKLVNCEFAIVTAKVTDVYITIKNPAYRVSYKFSKGNQNFEDYYDLGRWTYRSEILKKLNGKTIPLLYCLDNDNYNRILLSPDDFSEYGLEYPDSLLWVKEYIVNDINTN